MDLAKEKSIGSIRYSDDVIKTIISLAVNDVKGVAAVENRMVGGLLGSKTESHVGKINVDGKNLTVDLIIVVKYGLFLKDVAQEVQRKVYDRIESMTDLIVSAVNVTVSGLDMSSLDKAE